MGRRGCRRQGERRRHLRPRAAGLVLLMTVAASVLSACFTPRATTASTDPAWCGDQSSIMILGDSHSTGYGLPDHPGGGSYAPTAVGWTSVLTRRASDEWGTITTVLARNGAMAADFGHGGRWEETESATDAVHDVQPALVIVALGTAEFVADLPPADFDEHYRDLVIELHTASPRTTVLLVVQPQAGTRLVPDPVYPWQAYTAVIETVAADQGAEVLDLGEYLPAGGTPEAEELYLPDAVHLTAAGHRVVHAAVWTLLTTWCGP
ncbi:SGNH/GDSL hydrolase family protein [Saccharomonospora xinjiangensis]|uniref:SGNH/GDSL hydrolase family protein n=1 Tax=Saccharomonospora xinjiangensis TaxID=75294 RepID=UPI00350E8E1A